MRRAFSGWTNARRHVRLAGFFLPLVLALAVLGSPAGHAQQLPSLDQLQQLQQQMGQQGQGAGTVQNNPPSVVLQPAVPPLGQRPEPPSRLEQILSARAGMRLQQFGYDQLGRASAVTVPQTGAVQDDYVLGPGDEIIVALRGQENNEFTRTVDRNGQVVLPRLAPIPAGGRSLGSFRADVEAAVHRAYVATEASVSVGRLRQISVLVSGEVNQPGQRLLTGLSSAVDALLLSGGVKKTGSLRNVRIQRAGREFTVDLYSVLTDQGGAPSMRLADGDRILVPPLGPTVAVAGLVRRPGIFELAPRSTAIPVKTLLALAGGQEVRGNYRLSLLRILPDGRSDLTQLSGDADAVHDSEILFVQLGADQTSGQATLSGGTGLAGAYPIATGTRLSDLLKQPGALGASPYTLFGIIIRKNPQNLLRMLVPFTPVAVLTGKEDQALQSDDVVRVFSVNEERLLTFVVRTYLERLTADQNAIRNPLDQATTNANNSIFNTLAGQTGDVAQELDNVSTVPPEIQRDEVNNLLEIAAPGSELAMRRAQEARRRQLANPASTSAQAGLMGTAGSNPATGLNATQTGAATGPNAPYPGTNQPYGANPPSGSSQGYGSNNTLSAGAGQPGINQYSLQNGDQDFLQGPDLPDDSTGIRATNPPAANFINQPAAPGSFATNREVQTFGELVRQLGVDPLVLINFLVDHRARLYGAVRGPGFYFVGPNASLSDLVQAAGGTINWADESGVELISTAVDRQTGQAQTRRQTLPLNSGMLASYIVQPHDQLRFGQVFTDVGIGSVTIQGEVRYAGTYPIIRGEHLSELLARAGGLTTTAYPYGTVFLRQSAARAERESYARAANEIEDQLVIAMTRVGNDKIDPGTFASMQTFVADLRNQRALGRVSIVADPSVLASNPALDPLLEAGDVIYIPQRPNTVAVLGQVMQPGSYPYQQGQTLEDYVERAGGYASTADSSETFLVLPDGSARKVEQSWLRFTSTRDLPPGSSIVVPRDVTPLDLRQTIIDVSQIFSQLAVSIASVAVISRTN